MARSIFIHTYTIEKLGFIDELTKTCRAVDGTRTWALSPDGDSVASGDVLNELVDRRLLRNRENRVTRG